MPAFFWYQRTGGDDAWVDALSQHRDRIISETKPAFVTVLDADSVPDPTWGREEYNKMKYSGCLYFDWDAEDISDTIPNFQKLLLRLQDDGVNLRSLKLYATGGRGFHCEVPERTFNPKPPKGGTTLLPYIYKEMALELAVDTLDLRVYTGRKGRMWRVPGIERSNGKFKVPITVDEALAMTPELYDELCAAPRDEPQRDEPTLSTTLAAMFAKAQSKVDAGVKAGNKSKHDAELLAKFQGDFPPTVKRLMEGRDLMPSVGFQRIAMQLAITANALGKSDKDLVAMAEGLIQNHQGDSQRYNSPRKRREELKRMWDYTHDNPCYSYSRGGIKSICAPGAPTSDLDGTSETVGIGHVPDNDEEDGDEAAQASALTPEVLDEVSTASSSLLEGLMILNEGIFKRTADGAKMISNLSFRKPYQMLDAEDGMLLGLEADIWCDGAKHGRSLIDVPTFSSRAALSKFCSGRGGIFSGSDTQAGVVQLLLTRSATKGKRVIYIINKEGLDLVQNPTVRDKVSLDTVWSSVEEVLCSNKDVKYRFKPRLNTSNVFNSDLHLAKPLQDTEDTRVWVNALLDINNPTVVGQMLGWFVSCFHKQFYQKSFSQFPLLHPNGPAGSGKSLTTQLLGRMFYFVNDPVMQGCSANSNWGLKSYLAGSSSIPLLLDEYKPAEMDKHRTDLLLQHFRLLYNQGAGAMGGISRGGADSSFRDITMFTFSTPTAFIGESQEMQTAVVQRSLPVAFNPQASREHTAQYHLAEKGRINLAHLGAALLARSMTETVESRFNALDPLRADLRSKFDQSIHDRQVYNLAVVLAGLQYLDDTLAIIFGDIFREKMSSLMGAIYDQRSEINVSVMTEAAKVLNDMAMMSRTEDPDSEFAMREGHEYVVLEGKIQLLMRESFTKYFAWCKRKGFTPLYTGVDAFISAMGKSPAVVDRLCFDSPLKTSGQSRVFAFNLEKLASEGVEPFKTKASR